MPRVSDNFYPPRKRARVKATRLVSFVRSTVRSLLDAFKLTQAGDMQLLASSLSFSTVVSIVPLLAVSLSVFHAFGGLERMMDQIEKVMLQDLVGGAGRETRHAIRDAILRVHSGALGIGGMAGLLFVSTKLFNDMDAAIHRIWGIPRSRSLARSLIVYWLVIFVAPLALAAAIGALGSMDVAALRGPAARRVGEACGFLAIFAICKWVPSRKVEWRPALWSAIAGSLAFVLAQEFYSLLTSRLLNYNKVYGSLASIPLFFLWIWVLWQICLGTVAMCAAWQLGLDDSRARSAKF